MASLKELKSAAKELNEVLGLNPPIDVKASEEELTEQLKEGIKVIEEGDDFSDETQEVIDELSKPVKAAKPATKPAKKAPEPEEEEEEPEEEEEEKPAKKAAKPAAKPAKKEPEPEEEEPAEEENEYADLIQEIEDATKLSELKEIAKENDEFKKVRGELSKYKTADELREVLLAVIDPPKKKKETKSVKKEVKAEKKEAKPKGPGVISTIVECLEKAGKKGITKEEIHEVLVEKFPDKNPDSLKNTINVQVPYRVSKEHFELVKNGDKFSKK